MIRKTAAPVIEALFQYSTNIDFTERKISIFANLLFCNNAQSLLENPEISIHLSPASGGEFSGKILPPSLTKVYGIYSKDGKQLGWKFKEEDGVFAGNTNGVYRMEPIESLQLSPGQWAEINEMQFNFILEPKIDVLKVDAFVTGHGQICKVMNPIVINVS